MTIIKFLALLSCTLFLQAGGQPVPVPIQNPSFEVPTTLPDASTCGHSTYQNIPGWTFQQAPGGSYGVIAWTCQPPPDGKQVAFLSYGSSMSQDLGIAPQAGIYTMKFFVANWFYSYPPPYTVSLLIGCSQGKCDAAKPVCSISGYPLGDFTEVPLVCTIDGFIAVDHNFGFNGNLGIRVQQHGWPLLFDMPTINPLTFTPTN